MIEIYFRYFRNKRKKSRTLFSNTPLHKKISFPISVFSVKSPADLATFGEEILYGELMKAV